MMPSPETMYRALVRRDSTFEGVFVVGVKTTHIFCRPACPAKKPKPEHVEFFSLPREALHAGYRPCKRCNPSLSIARPPELVRRLRDAVEHSVGGKISGADLGAMGIDPSTARRQFQRYYGMTFFAYHRARRMGLALHEVRNGESVIGAQIESGFNSASGFHNAFRQLFGAPPSKGKEIDCMLARWVETPLGAMVAVADERGLRLLEFVDRRGLENEINTLRRRTGCVILPGRNSHLDAMVSQLQEYFQGSRMRFTVPLVPSGSAFEESVWERLRKIPAGETRSYSELAKAVGKPAAVRAVGRANGKNCMSIVIPCHRVIRSDGNLCGYGGGIWRKQWLIEHERKFHVRGR